MTDRRLLPLVALAVVLAPLAARADGTPKPVPPYEKSLAFKIVNPIDRHVLARLKQHDITPAGLCSDEVFVRRVYLDVIGRLPTPDQAASFARDEDPQKRAKLIDRLLAHDAFVDYWTMKWCDILRVKSEHPINLWPNGVQAYHRWIRQSIATNKPYDQFARELLTSSGSNFRVPPVNFYRAVQGHDTSAMAHAAALTFMGTRIDHWPEQRRENLEAFFSRVAFKGTAEWKEEIVYLDPAADTPLRAVFPDGNAVVIKTGQDPRRVFADWLIEPNNPYFTRNIVNRAWCWLLGRGIIHEPDDIRDDNPCVNPELLACLEAELKDAKYDLKHLFRLILNSRTYQQSAIPRSKHEQAEALFAFYPVRRLEAEVLIDALVDLFGGPERYQSPIPEPFTFVPDYQRTIALADGSITSAFLEMFGRPSRDSGLESERNNQPTNAQRLHLLNSTHIQKKIAGSPRLNQLIGNSRGKRALVINGLYMAILSRRPTPAERDVARAYLSGRGAAYRDGAHDLAWALINSKEFLYRH